jgi:hypothetical protein
MAMGSCELVQVDLDGNPDVRCQALPSSMVVEVRCGSLSLKAEQTRGGGSGSGGRGKSKTAGAVVGGLLGAVALAGIILVALWRKRRNRERSLGFTRGEFGSFAGSNVDITNEGGTSSVVRGGSAAETELVQQ